MKTDPLPAAFVSWLKGYILSQHFTSVRRLHRGLILRWTLWQDGNPGNAIPGYDRCPPAGLNDQPLGWSYQKFQAIARETIGTPVIHATRKRAAALSH
jgi:hypothetical protein